MVDPKPLRADARRNREAIVAAARAAFEAGEADLRFDDFARRAGVGTGTLYRHFPTRESLAAAVYEGEIAALRERAEELQRTLPPGEALAAFLHAMVDHLHAHEGLARTLVAVTDASTFAEGSDAFEQAVTAMVDAAAARGAIRSDVSAGAVLMVLHGLGAAQDRPNWRTESREVITLLLDGLRPPTPGTGR